MCERKPGPRCSADTAKTLQAIAAKVQAQQVKVDNAKARWDDVSGYGEQEGVIWPESFENGDKDYGNGWSKWREEVEKLETLKADQEVANSNYDATPEGLRSLEALLVVTGNSAGRKTLVSVENRYPYHSKWSEPVEFNYSLKALLEKRIAQAKDHRRWQASALESLARAEKEEPSRAAFISTELIDRHESQIEEARHELANANNQFQVLLERNASNRPNLDRGRLNSDFARNLYSRSALTRRVTYLETRLNDLQRYQEDFNSKEHTPDTKVWDIS